MQDSPPDTPKAATPEAQSFLRIRRAVGYLGLAFPFVLVIGGLMLAMDDRVLPTLSDYFFTPMRDVFTGGLIAIGFFLITYKGYEEPYGFGSDKNLTFMAGLLAICVAFFPFRACAGNTICTLPQQWFQFDVSQYIHYGAAVGFFAILARLCLVNFRMVNHGVKTNSKSGRDRIYFLAGRTILGALIALLSLYVLDRLFGGVLDFAYRVSLVLILESICIWAFAIAWLVKGRADNTKIIGAPMKAILKLPEN
ncbi:hypothetical protein GCM10008927_01140 [Amylibacter ulvae]|uniref:DUF998 domain-containing protein n=1 Tax=Paramylibacter ulvae TaxID=1651968 RepID=A0ABQ3CSP1_9RHOB|nr:hypothetical protein [Amylibacter ulvae]GHA40684.1 hypothetical protein GCM10008927_01140 [Amylibacter ulvae]